MRKASSKIAKLFDNSNKKEETKIEVEDLVTNEERQTCELVIGMVGPVGSGATKTSEVIKKILRDEYNYIVDTIKVSEIINENAKLVELQNVEANDPDRIDKLQTIGSTLRKKFGEDVLANFCIERIHSSRDEGNLDEIRRYCTIIDSLKHPSEVERLRAVYGELFWLVGVFAPEDVRIERLRSTIPDSAYLAKINNQDYDEGTDYGQLVKDTMTLADMFIRNDADNTIKLNKVVQQFLDRIFLINVSTPTLDETAMFGAASVAIQSACLSRQVGAVIQNARGEVIGQGANDVPKFGGGLYVSNLEQSEDHRCYNWRTKICHNDFEKDQIFKQIDEIAKEFFDIDKQSEFREFSEKLRKSRVKNLIEFSRAVHAEMAAIISVSRDGGTSTIGCTLFSTTFPCHNCAKHIVASGISKVVYIEPYPKSLALKLHNDAISTKDSDRDKKVSFLQYEGVAPRSFSRIFKPNPIRKVGGTVTVRTRMNANPQSAAPIDSLVTREELEVAKLLREKENVKEEK